MTDFPAFGPLKKALRGEQFEITDQVETFVFNWLDIRPALLYENGMRKVPKLCEKYIVEGDHYLGKSFVERQIFPRKKIV